MTADGVEFIEKVNSAALPGVALSALWYLGKNNVTPETVATIAATLGPAEFETLRSADMPAWMAKALAGAARERPRRLRGRVHRTRPPTHASDPSAYTRRDPRPWDGAVRRATVVPMRPDLTYKTIFGHAFMVEELMRWLVADLHGAHELVHALDFSRLRRVHEQSVADGAGGQHGYANDMVWRAPLRGRHQNDAGEAWLYLVMMLEFQSDVDFLMALRVRNYVDNLHMEIWRGTRFGSADRLAPVLPIVLYTGESPWSAAARVIDLVTPDAPGVGEGDAGVASRASALFAGDGYLLLDTLRVGVEDLRDDNAAALLAGVENQWQERIPAQLAALRRRLDAPELAPLREVILRWAQHLTKHRSDGLDLGIGDMAEIDRMHESGELEGYFAERVRVVRDRYRAEGRAEGIERGIERGLERGLAAERGLLCRQAARKFGGGTAERLAGLLAHVGDTGRLAQVGDWIIDCATGEDLIGRFGNGS